MVDEIQIVTWCDGHRSAASPCNASIRIVQRLMNEDECRNDGIAMAHWNGNVAADGDEVARRNILFKKDNIM